MRYCIILVLAVSSIAVVSPRNVFYTGIVPTKYGPIRGEEAYFEGMNYKAFRGIPYASPPVGELRFKAPQPPQEWSDVRDATVFGNICHQLNMTHEKQQSEDCLTLNVYTRSLAEISLKPVIVFIHGGSFFSGDSTDDVFGPEYLLKEDVVAVTINYRLGVIGFLSILSTDASGNWGLKDQAAALKWVQENIVQFGGDPKQVTVYGESAGSASAHLHLFSPLSKGSFHGVIASSATAANHWVINSADYSKRFSRNMARVLGASADVVEDPAKRLEFLRAADAQEMMTRMSEVFEDQDNENFLYPPIPFAPVVEPAGSKEAFLTEDPKKLLAEGNYTKVPLMMGVTDLEGGLIYMGFDRGFSAEMRRKIEKNVCQILPSPLKEAVLAKNDCQRVAQEIRNAYFDGQGFDSSMLNFIYLYGDLFMTKDAFWTLRMHAQNEQTPVYYYYFKYDGSWNLMKKKFNITYPGASHADDLFYVFRPRLMSGLPPLPPSLPEVVTKDRMISFITNFMKFGNPTPSVSDLVPFKWEPATKKESLTMHIGNELTLKKGFLKTRIGMWDQLYNDYTGKPFYP